MLDVIYFYKTQKPYLKIEPKSSLKVKSQIKIEWMQWTLIDLIYVFKPQKLISNFFYPCIQLKREGWGNRVYIKV